MTPPHDPPRPLHLLPPIPREEPPAAELPPPAVAPDAVRLDAVITDLRGHTLRRARAELRARRLVWLALGSRRALRRIERSQGRIEDGQLVLAADVSRALGPVRTRATVAAGAPVIGLILFVLKWLIGD